ncbi:hypothetical protein BJX62DRAFT_232422 [Aspergillus germanicus]
MTEDEPIAYNWIRSVECLEGYRPGGYHPVMVSDTLHDRYHIVDKLGSGGYSTVWLARNDKLGRYVTLKVCIADAPPRETKVLKALSASEAARDMIPALLDKFKIQGPNGNHTCYTVM